MKTFVVLLCLIAFHPIMLQAVETRTTALLDISKSISQRDFEKAKIIVNQIADTDNKTDITSVYLFGSKVEKIDRARLAAAQLVESNSAVYDSAYEAAKELSSVNADRKTVVIFSDGYDTSSVITLEDLVTFARKEGVVIDAVAMGRSNRKVLERIAKLTGGAYFHAGEADLARQIRSHNAPFAHAAQPDAPAKSIESPAEPAAPGPATARQTVVSQPASSQSVRYWIAGLVGAVIALMAVLVAAKRLRTEARVCPSCGRALQRSETTCPDCVSRTKEIAEPKTVSGESTQNLSESIEEQVPMVSAWPERSQQTQEIMTQTYVLAETPVLIVKKGKHRGKSYALDAEHPVSIGRSRVNEIRVEDEALSAQHCRIIPENGRHVLYDLDSTNGTYVGDSKITRSTLNHGDTIKVGDTYLVYKIKQTRQ